MEIMQQKKQNGNDGALIAGILAKYISRWMWFVASVAVCLGVGALFLLSRDVQYKVSLHAMLNEEKSLPAATDAQWEAPGIRSTVNSLENEIAILHSPDLMAQVVKTLHLDASYFVKNLFGRRRFLYSDAPYSVVFTPDSESGFRNMNLIIRWNNDTYIVDGRFESASNLITFQEELRELPASISLPDNAGTLSVHATGNSVPPACHVDIGRVNSVATALSDALKIEPASGMSSVLKIDLYIHNPETGAAVLEELVRKYNESARDEKKVRLLGMSVFINDRLKEISAELDLLEDGVEEYRKKNRIADRSSETELYMQQTGEYERQKTDAETQLRIIGMIERFVLDNPAGEPIPSLGVSDHGLSQAISDYNTNIAALAQLLKSTSENNPSRRRLEKNLASTRYRITSLIRSERESLRITLASINRQGSSAYSRIQSVSRQERGLLEKERQQKVIENLFLYLMQKREEMNVAMASTTEKAKVVVAPSNGEKVYPSNRKTLSLFMFFGLAFPAVFIFLADFFRTSVGDIFELKRLTGARIIGEIRHDDNAAIVMRGDNASSYTAEQFRMLRNNIDFHFGHETHKLLLVASSACNEGKTFVSINLALAFTLLDRRVLLADIDMRRVNLNSYLNSKSTLGLTDFLSGHTLKWENSVEYMNSYPSLHILKAGAIPPNPNELLMGDRFRKFIREAREAYDCVIIDSPPVGVVSDAFIIAEHADMTLYVVREKQTPKATVSLLHDGKYMPLTNPHIVYNDMTMPQFAGFRTTVHSPGPPCREK